MDHSGPRAATRRHRALAAGDRSFSASPARVPCTGGKGGAAMKPDFGTKHKQKSGDFRPKDEF